MIGLINLGNSNLQSVINALDYLEIKYNVTNNYKDLSKFDKLILPGVGTFGNGVTKLKELNLMNEIKEEVLINQKPIFGICLGMQLLFSSSKESTGYEGLNLLEGEVINLPKSPNYRIPRIGWAQSRVNFDFLGLKKNELVDFYYIHSYYVKTKYQEIVAIETDVDITAAVMKEHIYGCQFHPEKSHIAGLNILKSFAKL